MLVNFRQGIVRSQTSPSFLTLSNGIVSLNVNSEVTIFSVAYQETDYLFTENISIDNAWQGPFLSNNSYWLYWDIDMETGIRTFGTTTINPFLFGSTPPISPLNGQHFFFYIENVLKVFNGKTWIPVLRVFAGKIESGNILIPQPLGSQVNLLQTRNQGHIIFDNIGSPIKNNRNYFITTETIINTQNNPLNNYKIEAIQLDGKAVEPIPKYSCVTWKGVNKLGLASYTDFKNPSIGIAIEDMSKDSVRKFKTNGYLTNPSWNFLAPPNSPVWVGLNGEVTTIIPKNWSFQRMGYVISSDTIFIKISEIVLLENQITFPTPTPTASVTPSITITPSITPTNTITPSITPTITTTITPSTTLTITPTASSTVTPSITITPTLTFTPTNTSTPSTTPTQTPTNTPSNTITPSNTLTPVSTATNTPTVTPTISVTPSITGSNTPTPTVTPTITDTATVTPTQTPTNTLTATNTPSNTITPTVTVTPTNTVTPTLP